MYSIEKATKVFHEMYGINNPMENAEFVRRFSRNFRSESDLAIEDRILDATKNKSSGDDRIFKNLFSDMLDSEGIEYIRNYELGEYIFDFKLKDSNTVIQICNTNTHNNVFSFDEYGKGINSNLHEKECKAAIKEGLKCIHVFDWDDPVSILNNIKSENIEYSDVSVEKISESMFRQFLSLYDMNKDNKKCNFYYGIFSNNDLISVGAFRHTRRNKYDWELTKYCEDSNVWHEDRISKLIDKMISDNKGETVSTYLELSKYNVGCIDALEKCHFSYRNKIYPNRIWSKGIEHVSQSFIGNRSYSQLFHIKEKSDNSTYTQFIENGWLPVYDCGKWVYVYEK